MSKNNNYKVPTEGVTASWGNSGLTVHVQIILIGYCFPNVA